MTKPFYLASSLKNRPVLSLGSPCILLLEGANFLCSRRSLSDASNSWIDPGQRTTLQAQPSKPVQFGQLFLKSRAEPPLVVSVSMD